MDIFNRKKIRQLEEELKQVLLDKLDLQNKLIDFKRELIEAKKVQEVKHITHTVDAVELANKIKAQSPKRGRCGGGKCGYVYHVRAELLELK